MPVLLRSRRVWRIADRSFPIYSPFGAAKFGARWNSPGVEVIYAASSLEGAMLELRAHTGNLPPPQKHGYIWIQLPKGLSYEKVARSKIPGWRNAQDLTRALGDEWIKSGRSCLLMVPSVLVPDPYLNVLINPNHPEAHQIQHLRVPKPLKWDPRLFEN